jgi:hypothetical protein
MISLGRINYERYCKGFYHHMDGWVYLEQKDRDAWEMAAQAVVDEYEERRPEPDPAPDPNT